MIQACWESARVNCSSAGDGDWIDVTEQELSCAVERTSSFTAVVLTPDTGSTSSAAPYTIISNNSSAAHLTALIAAQYARN